MSEWLELGTAPPDEDTCVQAVEGEDYMPAMQAEAARWKKALLHYFGEPPEGARLSVRPMYQDGPETCEVVCYYDPARPDSIDYAFRLEREMPPTWEQAEESEWAQEPDISDDFPESLEWRDVYGGDEDWAVPLDRSEEG